MNQTTRMERLRDLMERRQATPFSEIPHGELGYAGYGCHCQTCRTAEAARRQRMRRLARGKMYFDQVKLYHAVDAVRAKAQLSWREVSQETGVGLWEVQHIADGAVLSVYEVVKLMLWGAISAKDITSRALKDLV